VRPTERCKSFIYGDDFIGEYEDELGILDIYVFKYLIRPSDAYLYYKRYELGARGIWFIARSNAKYGWTNEGEGPYFNNNMRSRDRRRLKELSKKLDEYKKFNPTCEGCIFHNDYLLKGVCNETKS